MTQNRHYADRAIALADRFFHFDFSQVCFSGFAREDDEYDGEAGNHGPCFYVEVWRSGGLYCSVGFVNVGILGTLHVELMRDRDPTKALGRDYVGEVRSAINRVRGLPEDLEQRITARADGNYFTLGFDLRP